MYLKVQQLVFAIWERDLDRLRKVQLGNIYVHVTTSETISHPIQPTFRSKKKTL